MIKQLKHLFFIGLFISLSFINNAQPFTESPDIQLNRLTHIAAAWVDYNMDGHLDFLLTGLNDTVPVSEIYRNKGDGSFSLQTQISLTGFMNASIDWGDFDNDGDPDILIAGNTGEEVITTIYTNNGDNTFTEFTETTLPGVINGSVAWGDCDNDGDLDILPVSAILPGLYYIEIISQEQNFRKVFIRMP